MPTRCPTFVAAELLALDTRASAQQLETTRDVNLRKGLSTSSQTFPRLRRYHLVRIADVR